MDDLIHHVAKKKIPHINDQGQRSLLNIHTYIQLGLEMTHMCPISTCTTIVPSMSVPVALSSWSQIHKLTHTHISMCKISVE